MSIIKSERKKPEQGHVEEGRPVQQVSAVAHEILLKQILLDKMRNLSVIFAEFGKVETGDSQDPEERRKQAAATELFGDQVKDYYDSRIDQYVSSKNINEHCNSHSDSCSPAATAQPQPSQSRAQQQPAHIQHYYNWETGPVHLPLDIMSVSDKVEWEVSKSSRNGVQTHDCQSAQEKGNLKFGVH